MDTIATNYLNLKFLFFSSIFNFIIYALMMLSQLSVKTLKYSSYYILALKHILFFRNVHQQLVEFTSAKRARTSENVFLHEKSHWGF